MREAIWNRKSKNWTSPRPIWLRNVHDLRITLYMSTNSNNFNLIKKDSFLAFGYSTDYMLRRVNAVHVHSVQVITTALHYIPVRMPEAKRFDVLLRHHL